jgi:hypothetical protein
MNGNLWILYRNDIRLYKCSLHLDSLNENQNEIIVNNIDDATTLVKRINLNHIKKLTVNENLSWEISNENGIIYKFLAIDADENTKWIRLLLNYFKRRQEKVKMMNSNENIIRDSNQYQQSFSFSPLKTRNNDQYDEIIDYKEENKESNMI